MLLRRRGLNVIYLGANVPAERFEETVTAVHANLVILAAQTLTTAAMLQSTALALTGLRVPVGYGGRIFNLHPNLADYIPGHHLGSSLTASLDTVETLLQAGIKPTQTRSLSQSYIEAHQAFTSKRIHIESAVKENMPPAAHSEGALDERIDPQNLPAGFLPKHRR